MIISKNIISPEIREILVGADKITAPMYSFNTVVVGSGAAGLNCADLIASNAHNGQSVAIITEGLKMGTSRNTGSDKQTYYKLTLSGDTPDSVGDMAKSLFDGGSMDGDLALCEAAGSTRAFLRLVGLGVPFPYNDYGEFAGYQTDHDTRTRATSCGPLTSKYMTEALERSIMSRDIPIFDGHRAVKLLTEAGRAVGVATLCANEAGVYNKYGLSIFSATNTVWATGGPSAIYQATVYPESQTCAHGTLLEAGAAAVNVTESQYGLASVKFRWNLSGTYQQVLPRYYSTAPDGSDEHEFLGDTFTNISKLLTAVFKKGYQWPFDPAKLYTLSEDGDMLLGSSLVDIAVFNERRKGRRVFMDFRRNPENACDFSGKLDYSLLEAEPRQYLENSNAMLPTPIERLSVMNAPAIELYKSHGIDLYNEPLEIDMCAQHNNGGFEVDCNYQSSSISHLFVVGEAAGVFGIHRPGGSALNSTQVGSMRAAECITSEDEYNRAPTNSVSLDCCKMLSQLAENGLNRDEILSLRNKYASVMTECGAFMRNTDKIKAAIQNIRNELDSYGKYKASEPSLLIELMINRDILITQYAYLSAILEYIDHGGKSRGSYLIIDSEAEIDQPIEIDRKHFNKICQITLDNMQPNFSWRSVRPIPERDNWFENVYNAYRKKRGF
ncbi:MAG: FAD-binding protein [Clostridiales bacterium]|nr:FAD-binding protein [Clostridiales bacterium]